MPCQNLRDVLTCKTALHVFSLPGAHSGAAAYVCRLVCALPASVYVSQYPVHCR